MCLSVSRFRNINLYRLSCNTSLPSSSKFLRLPRRTCLCTVSSWLGFSTGCSDSSSFLIKNFSASTASLTVKAWMEPESKAKQIGLLNVTEDLYDGVTVDMKEPMDAKVFVSLLRASISKWRQQGKKGVWIKLPIELSSLVEPVVQVLVVKEKNGGFRGTDVWKLPTGVVNKGEDICTAAVREVKEETGIETEFGEVLAFRQSHRSFFRKSDLFFICMLRPRSFNIQKQDSEVEAAQEYVEQSYNKEHQLFKYVAEICKSKSEGAYVGFSAMPIATASGKDTYLYFNNLDFNKF
ncbi:hypothetical protein GH714_023054 [Hevea brasiliensis]|uniref:Nudix hydrolase domain-containing protein n=1 Tax=Hevea brasiliensis TaxID=3981 RepID=A0A6A6KTW5_HEVBR|nr:hypothetical protein GH714_023054 [Hevea brasiliensis]